MRLRISIRGFVGLSVGRSVDPSVGIVVRLSDLFRCVFASLYQCLSVDPLVRLFYFHEINAGERLVYGQKTLDVLIIIQSTSSTSRNY